MTSADSVAHCLALALLTIGCGTDAGVPPPDGGVSTQPLTLARDIQPILDEYCVGCHAFGAGDPHGEPHFTRDNSKRAFQTVSDCTHGGVRVPLVVPGRPEASFLMFKLGMIADLSIAGMPCVQTMPLGADAPLAEIDPQATARIRQWIADGAR